MTNPRPAKPVQLALIALVVLVAAGLAVAAFNRSRPATKSSNANTTASPSVSLATAAAGDPSSSQLVLSPSKSTAASGATVAFEVHTNSGSTSVNAVEADISYPSDKLEYVSIDDSSSAYSIKAIASGSNGVVKIARGTTTPVTGDKLLAKVTFKAKAGSGSASLNFLSTSALVSNTTHQNVVKSTSGAVVQFGQ